MFKKYFCSVFGWKTDDKAMFQIGNKILSVPMQAWECKIKAAPVKESAALDRHSSNSF